VDEDFNAIRALYLYDAFAFDIKFGDATDDAGGRSQS
jgi:hypothetical protein